MKRYILSRQDPPNYNPKQYIGSILIYDKVVLPSKENLMPKQTCVHGEADCVRCAMNDVVISPIHLHVILDVSPSMISRWSQTVSGLNEYIDSIRKDQEDNSQPYKVTFTTFSSNVNKIYDEVDLDSIPKFNEKKFKPEGSGTALYDAVGTTVNAINTNEPVLVVIITDGEENTSQSWNETKVSDLMDKRQALGNYTYAYLGVAKEAWGNATTMGVAVTRSSNNLQDSQYGASTYSLLGTLTQSYSSSMRSNSVSGHAMSVSSFWTPADGSVDPNASNVDVDANISDSTINK